METGFQISQIKISEIGEICGRKKILGITVKFRYSEIPKTETHVHLEGSISPELLLMLHQRHNLKWKDYSVDQIRQALVFTKFKEFLNAFKMVCLSIRREEDFADITRAFFQRLTHEHIVHCEFFYTPSISKRLGLKPESVLETILDTATREGKNRNISWALILDNVRQFPKRFFYQTLVLANRYRHEGVVGIGVGGDEKSASLKRLVKGFREAREKGLRIHLHTGETGDAESMIADLKIARPHRVGHGLPAAESAWIQDFLRENDVALDICPTSNLRTGVVKEHAEHPAVRLYRMDIPFTISTDDPALFDTTLNKEYEFLETLIKDQKMPLQLIKWQEDNSLLPEDKRILLKGVREKIMVESVHGVD